MINTQTNRSFIEAEVQSQFILRNLHDGLLPAAFYRDVTDFSNGETLNIPTIGEAKVQEVSEDAPLVYNPIESGNVQLQITDYIGDAYHITDKFRQDSFAAEALLAARGQESTRAIQEYFESRAFATLNAAQTNANPNSINGFAHRIASAEANNVAIIGHFKIGRASCRERV